MSHKRCYLCLCTKPLEDFHLNRQKSDGRDGRCKACAKAQRAALRERSPAAFRERESGRERQKVNARRSARRATKKGLALTLPCFMCGSVEVEAHHVAYDLPHDVTWMCRSHHRQLHVEHDRRSLQSLQLTEPQT